MTINNLESTISYTIKNLPSKKAEASPTAVGVPWGVGFVGPSVWGCGATAYSLAIGVSARGGNKRKKKGDMCVNFATSSPMCTYAAVRRRLSHVAGNSVGVGPRERGDEAVSD